MNFQISRVKLLNCKYLYMTLRQRIEALEKTRCCCCYTELPMATITDLVSKSLLIPNKLYYISDRGIYLNSISNDTFDPIGARKMLIPNFWTIQNIFDKGESYNIGDKSVWYGHVYENLTGSAGTNPYSDTINWKLIPKNDFKNNEYRYKYFGIEYDQRFDWIQKQWDNHNNVLGVPYSFTVTMPPLAFASLSLNPVDVSDWWIADVDNNGDGTGTMHGALFNNTAYGIFNNHDTDVIKENNIPGFIESNIHGLLIEKNTNKGSIFNNFFQYIRHNSNDGDIGFNHVDGFSSISNIMHNSNKGSILFNYMYGEGGEGGICYNSNYGNINGNGDVNLLQNSPQFIIFNDNKGDISSNLGTGNTVAISYNNNQGNISNNSVLDSISYNVSIGNIINNSADLVSGIGIFSIKNNSNNGNISGNSIDGSIIHNTNNGHINSCSSTASLNIEYNINNGNIEGVYSSTVSDAQLNK